MLNKLLAMLREYEMLRPGDRAYCALSGGADSMALLWGLYLLRERLDIDLRAAHLNHGLRGEESRRDEDFVREFCQRWKIPLTVERARIVPGEKGLEAAAREERYRFFAGLPGKTATAHTADDNAETVMMRLIRGTGLKGLGGICPIRGQIIRPMLGITRREVLEFLEEEHIPHVEDSTNGEDLFLRNRVRHRIMPLLAEENPRIGENLSAMALRLREDAAALEAEGEKNLSVSRLLAMPRAKASRAAEAFLRANGVREPESSHIALVLSLAQSDRPSAWASFPGGVTVRREYDLLLAGQEREAPSPVCLVCPGVTELPQWGLRAECARTEAGKSTEQAIYVEPEGRVWIRSRRPGDEICLPGGTRSLKKLFIDRKIPAARRDGIPVLCDDRGILGVYGVGVDQRRRVRTGSCILIRLERC